jgi:hypothetical protein
MLQFAMMAIIGLNKVVKPVRLSKMEHAFVQTQLPAPQLNASKITSNYHLLVRIV